MAESFLDVGQQVLVLFILIGVGALLTKIGMITENGAKTMTDVVLYAVTPCVIVNAFQREYQPAMLGGLLVALLAAFLTLLFSVLLAELLYRKRDIDRGVVLKFALVFSNCGFMALPLQEAVLGEDGVFYGAAYIAVFNLFMWTYGLIVMGRRTSPKAAMRAVDAVDVAVDLLVRGLDAVGDDHLTVQLLRLILRGEGLDLLDQLAALLLCDELGALDGVDQELQLLGLELAGHEAEEADLADLGLDDIHAEVAQGLDIAVDALALGGDAAAVKIVDDVGDRHAVFFIRPLEEELHDI